MAPRLEPGDVDEPLHAGHYQLHFRQSCSRRLAWLLKGGSSSSGSWMGGVLEALLTVSSRVLLNRVAIRGLGI